MPKITDLEHIKDEIYAVGDEKATLEEWKEPFFEVPFPEPSDIDTEGLKGAEKFDDAIASLDLDTDNLTPDDLFASDNAESADAAPEVPDSLLTEKSETDRFSPSTAEAPAKTVPESAAAEIQDLPLEDSNELAGQEAFDESADAAPSDLTISDDLFDTTDFNTDEPAQAPQNLASAPQEYGNSTPETVEPSDSLDLSNLYIPDAEAQETDGAMATSGNARDKTTGGTGADLSEDTFPITDTSTDEPDVSRANGMPALEPSFTDEGAASSPEPIEPAAKAAASEPAPVEFNFDDSDLTITDNDIRDITTEKDEAKHTPLDVGDAEFEDISPAEIPEMNSQNSSAPLAQTQTAESAAADEGEPIDNAEEAYKPVAELTDVQVPEIDMATGFAKKEDANFNGTFAPPEKFQEFADNSGKAFTIDAGEPSNADMEGDVPLAISEKDFRKFLRALDKMPLNLRKEIQNYIAYEDDIEVNKMELVNLVLKGTSLKKIVRYLEDNLKISVKIPKDFDKKSFEELERERKTFKYRLRHQILPLITIAGICTLLLCSLFVLAWHFIYKPVMAENYYKDGLYYIQNGRNTTAIEKFDKAGTFWKKKRWYFRYAQEFRNKKQYSSAELIYLRLLTDFNHDVEGGIEYSKMLSAELRDYAKAETVLRRQVLDYHPGSKEALVALGDLYLDWGLEDSEQFDKAGTIFADLLKASPNNDEYNAGMMKYYIRTDNLKKVLTFKDYFLKQNRHISQPDLNELGGYLLDCMYEPSPKVTTELKGQITDLREVLELSHKMNAEDPEANYNLGRFFVYNYKNTDAEYYLKKAIDRYGDEVLPLAQFFKKLDAMRLYGSIFLARNQHLEAETIFSKALDLYRTYSSISRLPSNKNVGKLFEAYGDIKYFIASDYQKALEVYTKAAAQNNDSASIRYKMGYINYRLQNYDAACTEFTKAYIQKSTDVNVLFALGNALFKRADYQLAQAYYERLMENLDAEKFRRGIILPQIREHDTVFVENYMKAANNLAVALNRLAVQCGNSEMNSRSFALFAESTRAWDALTRNPKTLIRVKNQQAPAYVNVRYMSVPNEDFVPEIYTDIPKTLENERMYSQLEGAGE